MHQYSIDLRQAHAKFYLGDMADIYDEAQGKADRPHRHNYYTVLFIEKASGKHVIDYKSYPFGRSEVHFVSPGQVHQVALTDRPTGRVFTFSKEFLAINEISERFISNFKLFKSFKDTPPLKIDQEILQRLKYIIQEMDVFQNSQLNYSHTALGALLKLFLINCSNSSNLDVSQIDEDNANICLFRDFKHLVESNFNKWHKVKDYAKEVNVTPKHLSSIVKSISGKLAKDFIQDRVLIESKRLLLHTDMSVKEIAYEIGFNEPLHFSGFFKKREGISPSKYRNDN